MATKYWEDRAALRQAAYDRANNSAIRQINQAYDRVTEQLSKDIDTVFRTYTRKAGMTPEQATKYLQEGIDPAVVRNMTSRVAGITNKAEREKLMTMIRTDGYRARISRMQALQDTTRVAMTEAADVELRVVDKLLKDQVGLAYNRMMYDMQSATGYGFLGQGANTGAVAEILRARWSGEHYSDRIWQNRDAMTHMLKGAMLEHASIGKLADKTLKDIRGLIDTDAWTKRLADGMKSKFKDGAQYAKFAANRLVRTESAYVCGQADALAYDEVGIEEYEFISTLDTHTSDQCQKHDGLINPGTGKAYLVSEKEVGVNYPPLHPFCRSTTGAVIKSQDRANMKRSARRPDGKTELVPADMNYSEWKRWQDAGAPNMDEWRGTKKFAAAPAPVKVGVDGKVTFNKAVIPDGRGGFRSDIDSVVKAQGFDGLPTVVSKEEYQKLLDNGSPYMTRGYHAPSSDVLKAYKKELREGDWYLDCKGGSVYGKGVYTASTPDFKNAAGVSKVNATAKSYAWSDPTRGTVEKLSMQPNSRIGVFENINKEYLDTLIANKDTMYVPDESLRKPVSEWLEKKKRAITYASNGNEVLPGSITQGLEDIGRKWADDLAEQSGWKPGVFTDAMDQWKQASTIYHDSDEGVRAVRLGYDAYDANKDLGDGACYRVVLNRTKLIIQK